jgi:TetR/AcrR family transcriptional repressor of nem operon
MSAAGLTHGGFYKHFGSKDELVADATRAAFSDILDQLDGIAKQSSTGAAARARVITEYLSQEHRDSPGTGCANAALAADAARTTNPDVRAAYIAGLKATIARLQTLDGGADAHARALEDLIVLVGALTLARAASGDPVSDELLTLAAKKLAST